ncbi:ribonuclease T2-like protein [Microdochium trichocladiopsis]|uniref:Ribonuclease T2-like n=1 Tax=Microdochium trichocladiopsis TaxID=1682393 RepID=A0A9P9BUV4_9PEZI|nr:ribonuclease T2-like protein [Microdochium trichocladiopsis]KAH7032682.1 ribonuclease T2-like protein [Microdochium trichocladiopsis]
MFGKTCLLPQAGLLLESLAGLAQLQCPLLATGPQSCHAPNPDSLNSCCYNTPGGQLLLTQFWDTAPSTGPADSWTLHGLWPDNCDGSYEQYCAPEREFTNITAVLAQGAPCTLNYMQTYWKDYQGNDESFWEHEFNKHGTCISTLDPKCYRRHQPGDEVVDYFVRAVQLFKTLPSYAWLKQAGIVPSNTQTYTRADIQAALKKHHGHDVIINCNKKKELNELWYHYNAFGSVVNGRFVPVDPVGSPSTCPETGIKYLPKYDTSVPPPSTTTTTTTASPTTTAAPAPTGTVALSGKGYLYASTGTPASAAGFLISGGKWYATGGTPATYTATPNPDGLTFTLNSSKGNCAIQDAADSSLLCSADVVTGSSFGWNGQALTYGGSPAFFADSVPQGQTQATVYAVEKAVGVTFSWSPR